MRKLVLQMQISIDGFVGGKKGDLSWIFSDFDASSEKWTVEMLWQADAHLMGGATYRDMAAHWPTSTEPYAAAMNQIPKIVFSRSLKDATWGETQIASGDLAQEIARLKKEPGRDLLAHGGARFAQSLVKTGMIDEYRLIVHPVALGSGIRLFPELDAPVRLKLVDTIAFGTGAIANVYRPT
jgi:dihydrofolate reductase